MVPKPLDIVDPSIVRRSLSLRARRRKHTIVKDRSGCLTHTVRKSVNRRIKLLQTVLGTYLPGKPASIKDPAVSRWRDSLERQIRRLRWKPESFLA
jgi:hypothetical protein